MRKLIVSITIMCVFLLSFTVLADTDELSSEDLDWELIASWEIDEDTGEIIENGLTVFPLVPWSEQTCLGFEDGAWEFGEAGERRSVVTVSAVGNNFLYFDIDDDCIYDVPAGTTALVIVEYFDEAFGGIVAMEYDAWHLHYANVWEQHVQTTFDAVWKTHQFVLSDVKFANRLKGELTDFRLGFGPVSLNVRKVELFILRG